MAVELDLPAAGVYTLTGTTSLGTVEADIGLGAPGTGKLPGSR